VLFILLSSRINVEQIEKLGWDAALLFAVVILVIRPLGVWVSTLGSKFNWKEIVFMSWVGPKGIVAAAVASLFSLQLTSQDGGTINATQAELILPLTFLVIVGTVILQGSTAKPLARLLKVEREEPRGYLMAGASENARFMAKFLKEKGINVLLADTSKANVREAKNQGLEVYEGNILGDTVYDDLDLTNIGRLLAMTSSAEVNNLAMKYFEEEFGEENVFRLSSRKEQEVKDIDLPKNVMFLGKVDYLNLAQAIRQSDQMVIGSVSDNEEYGELQKRYKGRIVPLFLLREDQDPILIKRELPDFNKGDKIAFVPAAQ
jgi:NhaP-type Na+/H+ or K+/H+ antiporter